jgi:hypothetical protein
MNPIPAHARRGVTLLEHGKEPDLAEAREIFKQLGRRPGSSAPRKDLSLGVRPKL